jgi:choline monooxygenase
MSTVKGESGGSGAGGSDRLARPPKRLPPEAYGWEETYGQTRVPVDLASTLIPDAYREPAFHEMERERVFGRSWVCVGYTDQVREPGDSFVAEVGGQPLLLTRDKGGRLRAFYNVCRHRGSRLVDADGRRDVIRCPYHSWGYALDGRCLGTPYFKGLDVPEAQAAAFDTSGATAFRKEDYGLLAVRVEAWGCFVFVNLDPDASPLAEWLGDLPERLRGIPLDELRLVGRRPYEIRANWKLVSENFMEYYHLPWVHPELCTVSGFDDHHRFQGPGMYTGMVTWPLTSSPTTVDLDLPPMPGLDPEQARTAYWILIFPSIALFLLPNHLFTLLLRPAGPGLTLESADLLAHPATLALPDGPPKLHGILDFWAMVNDQDIGVVEGVQKGLAARAYPGGRLCFRFEEPVHRFQNMVIDLMVGRRRVPAGDVEEAVPQLRAGR